MAEGVVPVDSCHWMTLLWLVCLHSLAVQMALHCNEYEDTVITEYLGTLQITAKISEHMISDPLPANIYDILF
jgi:hypothetical protein